MASLACTTARGVHLSMRECDIPGAGERVRSKFGCRILWAMLKMNVYGLKDVSCFVRFLAILYMCKATI